MAGIAELANFAIEILNLISDPMTGELAPSQDVQVPNSVNDKLWTNGKRSWEKVTLERCRYSIWGNHRADQCSRKWSVYEYGYGWCRQHAPSSKLKQEDERYRQNALQAQWRDREAMKNILGREILDLVMAYVKLKDTTNVSPDEIWAKARELLELRGY